MTHPVQGVILENISLIGTECFHLEFEVSLLVGDLQRGSIILNDYLGLAQETTLVDALVVAPMDRILSAGEHLAVEECLKRDVGREQAVEFPETGLVCNMGQG